MWLTRNVLLTLGRWRSFSASVQTLLLPPETDFTQPYPFLAIQTVRCHLLLGSYVIFMAFGQQFLWNGTKQEISESISFRGANNCLGNYIYISYCGSGLKKKTLNIALLDAFTMEFHLSLSVPFCLLLIFPS